jgi:hypothetical protein
VPTPRSGDMLRITRAASVQFITPILFRVISVDHRPTYYGWVWLDGYELTRDGEATERRSIFVQVDGLIRAQLGPAPSRNTRAGGYHQRDGRRGQRSVEPTTTTATPAAMSNPPNRTPRST